MKMQNQYILTPFVLDQPSEGLEPVAKSDWHVNAPVLPEGDAQKRMSVLYEPLAQWVEQAVRDGKRPVSVAGDCCATIGVLAGLQRAGVQPALLWLDAHGDFNTWETSPSGFIGGMPLAMLVGRGDQTMPEAVGLQALPETRVVLTDARDLDPPEKVALDASQVQRIGDWRAVLKSERLNGPLYVHFDSDIVNPKDAPAQGYATAGGPSAVEMREFLGELAHTKDIVAVSMCAWSPLLDTDGKTQAVTMDLFETLVGS
jgi:arginase